MHFLQQVFRLRLCYALKINAVKKIFKGKLFDEKKFILDPYAKAVAAQSTWGRKMDDAKFFKARVVHSDFDWGDEKAPHHKMQDLVIYELHVRNFTIDKSSGVKSPGTFNGIKEKIPYLKELGINCVDTAGGMTLWSHPTSVVMNFKTQKEWGTSTLFLHRDTFCLLTVQLIEAPGMNSWMNCSTLFWSSLDNETIL